MVRRKIRARRDLPFSPWARLRRIREIIELVDNRAIAADGPVTPTLEEMKQSEISEIYHLAGGKPAESEPEPRRRIRRGSLDLKTNRVTWDK
jgi:hypothetical protein